MVKILKEIADVFRPLSLDQVMQQARRQRMLSDERKKAVALECHIRSLNKGRTRATTGREWHYKEMSRKEMLITLQKKYTYLGLWEDAERIADELESLTKKKAFKQDAASTTKTDKHGFVKTSGASDFDLEYSNPQHMTESNAVDVSLCPAELNAMVMHEPTLFENKALKIKPFYISGKSPEETSSLLTRKHKKGFSVTLVKYYFALFKDHSQQQPPTE
jgi:hypothetical protein